MKRKFKIKGKKIIITIREFLTRLNWLYISIIIMIVIGIGILAASYLVNDNDAKNVCVGLGTGIVTSALVSLYIDAINKKVEKNKLFQYKNMLLNPLYNAIKSLYIHISININEYRVREEISGYLLLPMEKTEDLSNFLNELMSYKLEDMVEEKQKKLVNMLCISEIYYRELISQFRGLPLDSLLYENLISHEDYKKLKNFSLINLCMGNLTKISEDGVSEQDEYVLKIQLLHGMMLQMNRILEVFPDMASKIDSENSWIKNNLAEIYYNEIYTNSEEYFEEMMEKMEAEQKYYAEHPDEWENEAEEETEEDRLYRKINKAIWAGNAETIKKSFPEINKDNKQIQSELTWSLAKNVMKDKELRSMYFEKYGEKYKMRKDKRKGLKRKCGLH